MANLSEVMDHNAAMRKERAKKPQLDHLRLYEAENEGHIVEHHMDRYGSSEPERHVFEEHDGPKPKLPEGHVLQHIAKNMHIDHEVMKAETKKGADNTARASREAEYESEGTQSSRGEE